MAVSNVKVTASGVTFHVSGKPQVVVATRHPQRTGAWVPFGLLADPAEGDHFIPGAVAAGDGVAVADGTLSGWQYATLGTIPTPPPVTPPTTEPPPVTPPPVTTGLRVGIDAGNAAADVSALRTLGAKIVRLEIGASNLGNVASVIAPYKAAGIKVNLLVGFAGGMISQAQCAQVGKVAHEHAADLASIEIGNETGYGYQYHDGVQNASYHERASTYAHRFVECAKGAAGSGVGLLCQADDGGSGSSVWVDSMFAAEPKLNEYVSAYVVHSYGPGGLAKMERSVRFLGNHGVKNPHMASTEDGIATDNGPALTDNYGYARNLNYDAAGHEWAAHLTKLLAIPNMTLALVIYYQGRDQRPHGADTEREHYFGALQQNGQPKGGLTTEIQRVCRASA